MSKEKRLRAYVVSNGRTQFAVASTSQKAAVEVFNSTSGARIGRTSVGFLQNYGYIWNRGQVEGTDVIFEHPGEVFCAKPFNVLPNEWVMVEKGEG